MKEEDRQRTIRLKLARLESPSDRAVIATGFSALDSALGVGGLPRGRIVELFGPSSSGKTTLALQIVARLQRRGSTPAWIDAEHAFDPGYAASLGVAVERLPVMQPDSAEQALDIARTLASSGAVELLVIDSAAALVPQLELDTSLGEAGYGLYSRVLASGLRRLAMAIARAGTCVVFLNQLRTRRGSGGEQSETSAGGPPLKLYAAVRIALYQGTGRRLLFRILKNKAAKAFTDGDLEWKQGSGFVETP
ncbi:MAG TPA: hypothetical protein VGH38_05305 [Bryobacteraceae bacterium]